jgi:RNA-directed DNA polymerase
MRATLRAIGESLHRRRHLPIPEQGHWLNQVVKGYFAYHAVPTNIGRLDSFRTQVIRHWRNALRRRSQRSRLPWERMGHLANRWIPYARTKHPFPTERFDAKTRGKSPVR